MCDTFSTHRSNALRAWLKYRNIKRKDLAAYLGVDPSYVTRIIAGERAPAKHLERLKTYGIPADLLPDPAQSPGRPKKG